MSTAVRIALAAAFLAAGPVRPALAAPPDGGSIHAVVHGRDGRENEGVLRWNGKKSFWDQSLATLYADALELRERDETLEVFGLKLWTWKEHDALELSLRVPFGLIEEIERVSGESAVLRLHGGERLEVRGGADLAASARVEVEAADGSVRTRRWDEVERIEFRTAPALPRERSRLYGTVRTVAGPFTGFVAWDRDETMLDEVLDGDEAEIPFSEIASLHRDGRDGTRVVRRDGSEIRLSGTNDVDESNRGIEVRVAGWGTAVVGWDAFESFAIAAPPPSPAPSAFRNGPLRGRVEDAAGAVHEGAIVWGDHERHVWEAVDGEEVPGIALALEFTAIARIERTEDGAAVTLRGGERRVVRGDDAGRGARAITIRTASGTVRVPWSEVVAVDLVPYSRGR